MLALNYLILITDREHEEKYLEFFKAHGICRVHSSLSHGTANEKLLDFFSIERIEKVTLEAFVRDDLKEALVRDMYLEMNIAAQGAGVAVFVPIDCIGGTSALQYFVGADTIEKKEKKDMSETKNVLIITVVDKGNTDLVMEAARGAGASGGTVVKARGTGAELAKFFGVSISEEKEMIYIVANRAARDEIMHAIMEKAGSNTEAHGVLFSLPVDSVVGIKHFEDLA